MISVIIPTRNRSGALARTLGALGSQADDEFDIVVVDNGSADATASVVRELAKKLPVSIELLNVAKPGPAAARNRGIEAARGDVILFLGDDTAPAGETLVAGHAAHHRRRPEPSYGVVGHIEWDPQRRITPFMRWLERGGPQFSYGSLAAGPVATAKHFYTSNVSVKKDAVRVAGGFDERFPYAAVEDIELGVRLEVWGLRLEYDPELVVLHDHPTTLGQSLDRLVRVGRSARLYNELHPEHPLRELPVPARPAAVRLLRPAARVAAREFVPRPLRKLAWTLLHSDAYSRGYGLGPPEVD